MTALLRATRADDGENDDGDDEEVDARPLETLPAAWADAVAIQSPAMAVIEGAAEATWAVYQGLFGFLFKGRGGVGGGGRGRRRNDERQVRGRGRGRGRRKGGGGETGRRRFFLSSLSRLSRAQFSIIRSRAPM